MVAHLDEEESEVVPAMRRTFTQQEEQKVRPSPLSNMILDHRRTGVGIAGPVVQVAVCKRAWKAERAWDWC